MMAVEVLVVAVAVNATIGVIERSICETIPYHTLKK